MSTDFFDDDLLKDENSEGGNRGSGRREPEAQAEPGSGFEIEPLSENSLGRLARQKEETSAQMAGAVKEIEQLRHRQETLEKERGELEELRRRQEQYERDKRDMVQKLGRSVVLLEKEERQAARMVELLSAMRDKFGETLEEINGIDEQGWSDEQFDEELNRALAIVEDARQTYRQALAKIDAADWRKGSGNKAEGEIFEEAEEQAGVERGFGFWFKAGLAASLPLILVLAVLFALWVFFTGW